ncbi:MAG TPA: YidC/Oxa1 family membrane protein insertase [Longimicrobiales bacterium]|nr:YidC/Oxa1 family membrane protein insertase [Longimicrobiales bacterium]
MSWWTVLVQALEGLIHNVATATGGSLVLGILLTILGIRLLLIPIMLPLAVRTRDRNVIVKRMKPELAAIRKEFRKDPNREHKEISALHARHGIGLVDIPGLIGALIQLPVLIAMFQAVYHVSRDTPLAGPGVLTGLLASALSVAGLWLGGQADSRPMLALSAVLPLVMAIWLGHGIGLYLIAFYAGSALQGFLMRRRPSTITPVESAA